MVWFFLGRDVPGKVPKARDIHLECRIWCCLASSAIGMMDSCEICFSKLLKMRAPIVLLEGVDEGQHPA